MERAQSSAAAAEEMAAIEAAASRWVARRDAGLNAGEAAEFQRWLAADARHASAVGDFDAAWSALARPLRTGSNSELLDELSARAGRRRRRQVRAATAGGLAILVLGLFWTRPATRVNVPPAPVIANALVVMPAKRALPDGSNVELKDGARISVDYSGAMRRVRLDGGEAHFVVKSDADRPFIVAAGSRVEVRAVGTAFSVQHGESTVAVLVTEGRVAVEKREARKTAGPSAAQSTAAPLGMLEAGRRMVVDLGSDADAPPSVETVSTPEMKERLAWRTPRVEFNGTSLADCVALLNRHVADRHLRIDDPALRATRVSGVFRIDNIDSFVLLLEKGFGIEARMEGQTILLHRAVP